MPMEEPIFNRSHIIIEDPIIELPIDKPIGIINQLKAENEIFLCQR